jgi:hypothetical protein
VEEVKEKEKQSAPKTVESPRPSKKEERPKPQKKEDSRPRTALSREIAPFARAVRADRGDDDRRPSAAVAVRGSAASGRRSAASDASSEAARSSPRRSPIATGKAAPDHFMIEAREGSRVGIVSTGMCGPAVDRG